MEDCILVGGSGAVGQSITQALLDDGKKVTVLDEHPPPAGLMVYHLGGQDAWENLAALKLD